MAAASKEKLAAEVDRLILSAYERKVEIGDLFKNLSETGPKEAIIDKIQKLSTKGTRIQAHICALQKK